MNIYLIENNFTSYTDYVDFVSSLPISFNDQSNRSIQIYGDGNVKVDGTIDGYNIIGTE